MRHEDFACQVTWLCGLPGSGKDTWLSRNRSELPVVSLDDIRGELDVDPTDNQGEVVQLARERCREFLRSKTSFAFNATNILKLTRGRWIDLQRAWLGVAQHHQTRVKICEAIAIQQRRQSGVQEQTYHDETQFR